MVSWNSRITSLRIEKIYLIVILSLFSLLTLTNAQELQSNGPYFFRRLAALEYALPPTGSTTPRTGPWSDIGFIKDHDYTAVIGEIASAMGLLAVLSQITGVQLDILISYPLIPLLAAPSAYLLTQLFLPRRGAIIAAGLALLAGSTFPHFHEYVFGRYVFLPLVLYTAILCFYQRNQYRWIFLSLFILFQLSLKLSAPGTELVVIFFIAISMVGLVILSRINSRQINNPQTVMILLIISTIIFLTINQKFYVGVVGGIAHGGHGVSLILTEGAVVENIVNQLNKTFANLLGWFIETDSSTHPLQYQISEPSSVVWMGRVYTLGLLTIIGIYSVHQSWVSLRNWTLSIPYLAITAAFGAVAVNAFFRGVLLSQVHPKGLLVLLPIFGVIALWHYTNTQIVTIIVLIFALSLSGSIIAEQQTTPDRTWHTDQADTAASWQDSYLSQQNNILTDWYTWANFAYYYATHQVDQYWLRFAFTSYTSDNYQALINGKWDEHEDSDAVDYIVVDQAAADQPTKPQAYEQYEPLGWHIDQIKTSNNLNKIHSTGDLEVYADEEDT